MTTRQLTVTLWEEIGTRAECRVNDCVDGLNPVPRLHLTAAQALLHAREHVAATGHEVEIRQTRRRLVGLSTVTAIEEPAVEPNPHEQVVWDARTAC